MLYFENKLFGSLFLFESDEVLIEFLLKLV